MKLFLVLIFLPLGFLVSKALTPVQLAEEFIYELTVNSPNLDSAQFDLSITGFSYSQNEARIPFKIDKKNLKTPYKIDLTNGKYTVTISSKAAAEGDIISKVQGIKNGERMGFASGSSKKTILEFGFAGNYLVKKE